MRVTVVGSSSSIPRPGRACSSYAVDDGERVTVLDLGSGAFANLRETVEYDRIGAIVISHMHADHFIDLVPLRYALRYGHLRNGRKIPLHLPPDGARRLRQLTDAFVQEGGDFLSEVFSIETYDPSRSLHIGPLKLDFAPTRHFIPAFAIRVACAGAAVTYSADTAPSADVTALARNSDLFLCEATLLCGDDEPGETRGHSSAVEAAAMARDADVARLILTHYGDEADAGTMLAQARETFGGAIDVADDNDAFSA